MSNADKAVRYLENVSVVGVILFLLFLLTKS